jgi:cell shape-determining protein MreC
LNDSPFLGRSWRETSVQADYQKTLSALRDQETLYAAQVADLKVLEQENRMMKTRLERMSSLDLEVERPRKEAAKSKPSMERKDQ